MSDNMWPEATERQRLVVNVGCGPALTLTRTLLFQDWRQLRVDIEESAKPDIVADLTDLSPIADGSADAVWSSHCIEHLYQHQVPGALAEFHRVLADDGFIVILVPDLQSVAERIVADKFHEPVYEAPAGPINAHDMFYGFGRAIAEGDTAMAHKCGFTPTVLVNLMDGTKFAEYAIRRLPSLELAVVARKTVGTGETNCEALLQALAL
jgi:SAM-dependent methyltransferase